MFKCDVTGKFSKLGEKCNKIVAETRERVYLDQEGNVVGRGFEIVKELQATDEGVDMWQRLTFQD
jgi:hypothetical protein